MSRVLRSKNLATRFQILVEIASSQPNIQQKDIASKLGLTPQAISEHIRELVEQGLVASQGRSVYRVTKEGVDWLLKMSRDLHDYLSSVNKVVTNVATWTALAESNITTGKRVSLKMKDGLLMAAAAAKNGAAAVAVTDAKQDEEVGVSNIEGMIDLAAGRVVIVRTPGVQQGGSRRIDLDRLKQEAAGYRLIGAIGMEALAASRRSGVKDILFYGVKEAVIEAASSGLSCLVVCVEDEVMGLLTRLGEQDLRYSFLDLEKKAQA